MKQLFIIVTSVIMFCSCGPEPSGTQEEQPAPVKKDFTALTARLDSLAGIMKAKFALGYINMETGDTFSYNGNEHKPMFSTVKFPLAIVILQQVDAGTLKMDQKIKITEADMTGIQRSPLWDGMGKKAGEMNIHDMLNYMMVESDNVSCNKFTQMAGGVDSFQQKVHQMGMKGFGLVAKEGNKGAIDFAKGVANWCEPMDMAGLVSRFYMGELLNKVSTDTLRSMMERAKRLRISGKLPAGTVVAHKTGTSGMENGITAAVNDVGIVTLPNGNHLVLTVYVTEVPGDMVAGEEIIAEIAKAAYDHAVK